MSTCKVPPEVNFKWMEILEQLIACLMSVRQVHAIVFVKCTIVFVKCVQLYLSIIQVVGWRNSIQMWRREHVWCFNFVTTCLLVFTSSGLTVQCLAYWYIWSLQRGGKDRVMKMKHIYDLPQFKPNANYKCLCCETSAIWTLSRAYQLVLNYSCSHVRRVHFIPWPR